ncbi:hypothetical protein [Flavobacterium humidisoli]|uniref:Uncharacterized protein n=1 Tax=Flavobacterium humidisoli TaxID=2937442 RepID=A0ABY4LXS8_9FLAO|nr:hypothetical protein [Flavobacterium humidisoli]UPZ16606.1 hypothetical protein M0M44_04525 [Flavobacterium humidisoli]
MKKALLLLLIFFFTKSFSATPTKSDPINSDIKNQILILTKKNDSLAKRLDQIEKSDYKSVDVIEKVNDFYDKSWNRLIAFLGLAGSIILIVIPYIQIRTYDDKINAKTNELTSFTNRKVAELELKITNFHKEQFEQLRNEITLSQEELNKNINNEVEYLKALIFALRGMVSLNDKNYDMYFRQYTVALNLFIGLNKTSDIEGILKAINKSINRCIKQEIKITEHTKSQIDKLIVNLERDYYEIFPKMIDQLKTESAKL